MYTGNRFSPRNSRRLAAAVALVCAGTTVSPGVTAQGEALVLEEIIVTARKRFEPLQTVPVAVSAFTGETIDSLIMRDIREMEGFIPNMVIDSVSVAPGGASLYIRGVGMQEVEKSFDPAVGIVIDGVPVSIVNGSMLNTFDFAFMEVLRGPQGTLFGKNTTGGVVNVRRTTPTGELGLKYELTAGNNDRVDVKGVLNFPIVKEKLAAKLAYATFQDGGQMENVLLDKRVGDLDSTDVTATLFWTPAESFEALFTYQNYTDEVDGVPLQNIASLNIDNPVNPAEATCEIGFCGYDKIDEVSQDYYPQVDFELDAYTLEMNWELALGTITSITGYRDTADVVGTDFDATPVSMLHALRDQDAEQTSTELRFASSEEMSENWDFVAGFYWMEDEYTMRQESDVFLALGPPNAALGGNTAEHERTSWSVFGEAHFALGEKWNLTLGGRYTEEEKDYIGYFLVRVPVLGDLFPIPPEIGSDEWDDFSPKLGLDYQMNDDIMFYGTYSEGFRSGGYNARNSLPGTSGPYDPEYVNQYELGMKADFLDQSLRVNMATFYTEYEDKQEELIQPNDLLGSVTLVKNASEVEIFGVEGEFTWLATQRLIFNANFGYLDAEYKDYEADLNGDGIVTDNSDLELRRVPEWTGGVNANYALPLGPGTLNAFAGYRYTDKYWVDSANDPRGLLDSREVIDLNVSYEWEWGDGRTVKVTAFGRDITDEQAPNSAVIIPGFLAFAAVGGGREYGLQVSGNF